MFECSADYRRLKNNSLRNLIFNINCPILDHYGDEICRNEANEGKKYLLIKNEWMK